MNRVFLFFSIVFAILFTGCLGAAASRGEIVLQGSEAKNIDSIKSAKGVIFIRNVTDGRKFENEPKDASIPSIYDRRVEDVKSEEKNIYIGRKRLGAFGKAMENIVLDRGQTVTGVIKNSVSKAFLNNGYYVLQDKDQVNQNTLIVDIDIFKFWSFFRPGFWTFSITANIKSDITINSKKIKTDVEHFEKFHGTFNIDKDYQKVVNAALKIYEEQLTQKISNELK